MWWRARRKIRILLQTWGRKTLRFSAASSEPVDGATLVLPARSDGMPLQTVTDATGAALAVHPAVLDGADCAMVTVARLTGTTDFAATYG